MDFLKSQFARVQQQFGQLTASQKMLSVALMTIMVMTLLWWGRYAGTAEMEPLLDQEFAAEDFSRITSELRGRGIPYTASGSRILVPADRRYEVLAELGYEQVLPKDMSSAFSEIVAKLDSPLNSQEKSAAIRNEAKQLALGEIIHKFPGVHAARVVIDATQKRSFDGAVAPKAAVDITMKPGHKADNRLVKAAADMVSGAVAGLQTSNVKVIVDGVSRLFASPDGGDGIGGTWMDMVREAESYYAARVCEQLAFCDGVMVHVNVRPKDEYSESNETKFDPKGTVSKETDNETETSNSTSANRPAGGDVGVAPNTGSNQQMSLGGGGADGGGGGGGTSLEKTRTKTENFVSTMHKVTRNPAGSVAIMSASVGLPRSFFVKAYKSQTHTDKEPGEAVLGPFIKDELDRCRKLVKACLTLPGDDALVVDTYADIVPSASDSPVQAASGVSLMLGGHAKEIALAALAVLSLFMVSMMVRKGASGPGALATSGSGAMSGGGGGGAGTAAMHGTGSTVDAMLAKAGLKLNQDDAAAEVSGGTSSALEGVELDSATVRAQQVAEQVSSLVKENPDAAANLIKRWMNRA